jgi:hypothetical protein
VAAARATRAAYAGSGISADEARFAEKVEAEIIDNTPRIGTCPSLPRTPSMHVATLA